MRECLSPKEVIQSIDLETNHCDEKIVSQHSPIEVAVLGTEEGIG